MMAVLRADRLGGYESIFVVDSFEMEYWELEQAKLKL
jgi:rhamnose utilization protein RhaD (predicted bifunctional aldolase and dehydrogenase)